MGINIAIDGPAGAGKSTIAKKIASDLGYIYVDTGAMYRAMALYMINSGVDSTDKAAIITAAASADISIGYVEGEQRVFLQGEDVTAHLRDEAVGNMASVSSALAEVREKLTQLQRKLAAENDVVMDGRDIGTVVLPKADIKIFLTAKSSVRAKRRYDELISKGETADLDEIERDIIDRDSRDMNRETAPLKQAEDAVLVDSSYMSIKEVVDTVSEMAKRLRVIDE